MKEALANRCFVGWHRSLTRQIQAEDRRLCAPVQSIANSDGVRMGLPLFSVDLLSRIIFCYIFFD
jgi:hypothetical protein